MPPSLLPRFADWPKLLALAAAYGLFAAAAQMHFTPSGDATSASLVWPASGLALAALLLGGARLWPAILLSKLACNLLGGQALAAGLLGAAGASAAALLGCWLLQRAPDFDHRLVRPQDFLWLTVAALLSPVPSALLGSGGLLLSGDLPPTAWPGSLLHWWQGDALGVLLSAPLLLVWRELPGWRWRRRGLEFAACLGLTLVLAQQVLLAPPTAIAASLTYLPIIPLGWAALRFGRHGTVLVLACVSVFALLGVAQQRGAFGDEPLQPGLLQLWLYLLVLTAVGLGLALSIHAADAARRALAESEERFRLLAAFAPIGIYRSEADGRCIYTNARWQELSGLSTEETLGEGWSRALHPEDRERVLAAWRDAASQAQAFATDFRLLRADGEIRHLRTRACRLSATHGGGFVGIVDDITEQTLAQAALREANDRLEERVAARTEALTRTMQEQRQAETALAHTAAELRSAYRRLASAQEMEHRRLTAELHDRVGQTLTALGLGLSLIGRELPPDAPAMLQERLQEAMRLQRQVSQRVRDLMADLHPPMLDDFGLPAALRWWSGELTRHLPLQVRLHGEEALPRLPAGVETQLFRIAQEALMNIVKHADATRVDIALAAADGRLRLSIEDDGRGFDPDGRDPQAHGPCWGLVHMRERALAIDGELRIASRPQAGTRVEVEAPLP